jgi:hypothetical protein
VTTTGKNSIWLWASLSLGGCIYNFDNPAQQLASGTITGHVTLQNAAEGVTTQDAGIEIAWTGGLGVRLDATGNFYFIPLPGGSYTLNLYLPPPAANDFPFLAQLGVALPANDALNIPNITLAPSALVSGTVTHNGVPVAQGVVAAYAPPDSGMGPGDYEGFAVATDGGHFAFYLPAGNHVLAASDSSVALTMPVQTLDAGTSTTQDFPLDGGAGAGTGNIEGQLVFGLDGGTSGDTATINAFLVGMQYVAMDPLGNVVADGGVFSHPSHQTGSPDIFVLLLPAGQPLNIAFILPDAVNPQGVDRFDPLVLAGVPSLAGEPTFLAQVTWLPVSTFLATAQANLPDAGHGSATNGTTGGTSGGTTGGSTGGTTTGGSGGIGQWKLVNSLTPPTLVDGGPPDIYGVVALPLADGGNRLVWASSTNVYYADDPGMFGPPVPLIDAGEMYPARNLSAAAVDGGSVVAWIAVGSGIEAAFIPAQGGVPTPISVVSPVVTYPSFEGTATFTGSLGGIPGTFVIAPDPMGGLAVLFTSDNKTFPSSYTLDLETGSGPIYVSTVAAAPCAVADLATSVGFCFVGSGTNMSSTNVDGGLVFAGSVDTSGASPATVNTQRLLGLPNPVTDAVVALAAIPNDAGPGDTVYATAVVGAPTQTQWTSFTSLATAPVMQPLPGGKTNVELLLPWAGQALGLSLSEGPNGVAPLFVPTGAMAASFLPDVLGGYPMANFGILNGYTDLTGRPTVAVSADQGGTLSIWQLPSVPGSSPADSGMSPDAGSITDAGWIYGHYFSAVDGGDTVGSLPLPARLLDGGWGHRVIWTQASSTGLGTYDLYLSDDTSGAYTVSPGPTGVASSNVFGAVDSVGNSLLAFQSAGTVAMAYLPSGGTLMSPVTPDQNMVSPFGVVTVSLGSTPGFAVIGQSLSLTLRMAFTTDGTSYSAFDIALSDAGLPSGASVAPCGTSDLAGDAGFCVAGLSNTTGLVEIFAAAISTAGPAPSLAGYQVIYTSFDAGVSSPRLLALGGTTSTPVTLAFFDGLNTTLPSVLHVAQFTGLAQAPAVTDYPQNGKDGYSVLLLPWREGPLAIFDLFTTASFVRSLVLPPGTSMPPPDFAAGFGSAYGYADPQTGTLVVTPNGIISTGFRMFELSP